MRLKAFPSAPTAQPAISKTILFHGQPLRQNETLIIDQFFLILLVGLWDGVQPKCSGTAPCRNLWTAGAQPNQWPVPTCKPQHILAPPELLPPSTTMFEVWRMGRGGRYVAYKTK